MLHVKNLHKSYQIGKQSYEVLKGVSLSVHAGEFVAVMGPSGSGKTTLLNCISCYLPFQAGEITLGDVVLAALDEDELARVRNTKLGFVFQDFMLLDGLTVRDNILLPRIIGGDTRRGYGGRPPISCASYLGSRTSRTNIQPRSPAGKKQRTAVARALINHPLMILADEPTGNLDSKSSRAVIASFERARQELGATIFMVTHDSFSASYCDRVILMRDGMCVFRELPNSGNRSAFQDELLSAIKDMSGE